LQNAEASNLEITTNVSLKILTKIHVRICKYFKKTKQKTIPAPLAASTSGENDLSYEEDEAAAITYGGGGEVGPKGC